MTPLDSSLGLFEVTAGLFHMESMEYGMRIDRTRARAKD